MLATIALVFCLACSPTVNSTKQATFVSNIRDYEQYEGEERFARLSNNFDVSTDKFNNSITINHILFTPQNRRVSFSYFEPAPWDRIGIDDIWFAGLIINGKFTLVTNYTSHSTWLFIESISIKVGNLPTIELTASNKNREVIRGGIIREYCGFFGEDVDRFYSAIYNNPSSDVEFRIIGTGKSREGKMGPICVIALQQTYEFWEMLQQKNGD